MAKMVAIVFQHGEDDFELYQLDHPENVVEQMESILADWLHRGCSVRGTAKEIAKEMEEM